MVKNKRYNKDRVEESKNSSIKKIIKNWVVKDVNVKI